MAGQGQPAGHSRVQLSCPHLCCLLPRGGSCGPSSMTSGGKPTGIGVFREKPTHSWEHCSKTEGKKRPNTSIEQGDAPAPGRG